MWVKLGQPVGIPCGQARGQAEPVHRLSISGCPRVERSEPSGRAAIIHISTGSEDGLRRACLAAKQRGERPFVSALTITGYPLCLLCATRGATCRACALPEVAVAERPLPTLSRTSDKKRRAVILNKHSRLSHNSLLFRSYTVCKNPKDSYLYQRLNA